MQLEVDRGSGVPVSTQLAWRLRAAIDRGELAPGDQLPSLRDAATASGLNVNTVRAVYAKLEAAGVVTTVQGRGTFVAQRRDDAQASARRRELSEQIALLEAELVNLPALPGDAAEREPDRGARLLSVAELETVRDVLAARVAELHAARAAIRERLATREVAAPPPAAPEPPRAPSRRSSSSLAGARVRWT